MQLLFLVGLILGLLGSRMVKDPHRLLSCLIPGWVLLVLCRIIICKELGMYLLVDRRADMSTSICQVSHHCLPHHLRVRFHLSDPRLLKVPRLLSPILETMCSHPCIQTTMFKPITSLHTATFQRHQHPPILCWIPGIHGHPIHHQVGPLGPCHHFLLHPLLSQPPH